MSNTINLGNFISEYSVRNRAGDDIPVYSVTNKEGFCRDYFSKDVASQDRSTYKIVPRGCFAYNPSRINVGSVDWQRKEDKVIVSPLYVVFSVSKGLDQQYLYYYLKSEKCLYYIKELASGSVRDNLKLSMLKEFTIPNITLEEQRKAVMVLEQTDRLIALQERQMTVLDELVKSRFVEMFREPTINSKNWKRVRFDSLCENLDGKRRPITSTDREAGPYPYYGASGIVDHVAGFIFDEDILLVSEDGANLLARSTPIAFSVSGKVWVNNHAHVLRFNNFALQKYVEYYFSMISIEDYITGSTQPKLNQAKLNCMMIPLPSDSLQEVFMRFVAEIDKSKLAVKQSLEKLETLKKSLMQQYFG